MELKVAKISKPAHMTTSFLIHRVELKELKCIILVYCVFYLFLIHRVELKELQVFYSILIFLLFLIHRVELKGTFARVAMAPPPRF